MRNLLTCAATTFTTAQVQSNINQVAIAKIAQVYSYAVTDRTIGYAWSLSQTAL